MAYRSKRTSFSITCDSSSSPITTKKSFSRRMMKRMFCFANYYKRDHSIFNRKSFRRDIEEEEFQCTTTPCLSSYYSVFVVRLAIMIMLAILIGLLTLLTWHFTKVYTKRSLNTLAYGLRHELLQRPILRMWNILNSTVEIATAQVKLSELVIKRYSNPVNQAQQVELYEVMRDITWALFASRKALNSITISYKNGFVQAFHRDHRSNNTYYIYSDLANYSISGTYGVDMLSSRRGWNDQSIQGNISAIWYRAPLNPLSGEKIGKAREIPPDELINIAGISQVPDGAATWHVAVSKYSNSPLLSAALPVWGPSNESIVAVVGVTTALYSVGQLMKELVEFHSGHIYLTSQEGWLLATSSNTPILVNSTRGGPKLIMPDDSEDPVIRSGAKYLQKEYGNSFPPSHEVHIENVKIEHQLYYIDSFFLNLKRLPMVGVIIIPRKYIMGKVDEKAMKTVIILISASLGILIIGCICIFILTSGVSKEMKLRAELISHLDARRKAEASSNFKSQFLANMSHELRTPMAAVIGLLDILKSDDCLTNDQFSMVAQIRRCSTALLRLLNNILDLSKVESGKLVLEEAEFDLSRELEGLVDMFSVQCIDHNVEIILDLDDEMPRIVQGDSARVVQIFANLISNSIKFTTAGHIILRGWSENLSNTMEHKDSLSEAKMKSKQQTRQENTSSKKDNKIVIWFEVEDTGCGIDPSKWESVFESFEQADPSTTRLHGGTGLGLCIVRNLVDIMGGEIKVVKKNGAGTLLRLYLLLGSPPISTGTGQHYVFTSTQHKLSVLLALNGKINRSITSQWLQKNGMDTYVASDWNELTQTLQELSKSKTSLEDFSAIQLSSPEETILVIVIEIGFLNWTTDIWMEQLKFLDMYQKEAKFAWILNHDTHHAIKLKLRGRGYPLMVNRPLYKTKMIHIFETVVKEINTVDESLEIDARHSDAASSDDSDRFGQKSSQVNRFFEFTQLNFEENVCNLGNTTCNSSSDEQVNMRANDQKCLQGLCILLAEDTPVLQKVATIMLEKMGAKVMVVGDGVQAVEALKVTPYSTMIDLILMDCQMPKMDGYEATRAIREEEIRNGKHIPIVALTAHAMPSDEAKCLEVGMDAYLTKPIDCNLMVSTILTLTTTTL